MNTLTPEHHAKIRELLTLWLEAPDRDLDAAAFWCERWIATRPYTLTVNANLPWIVAGGYHETRRTPWR